MVISDVTRIDLPGCAEDATFESDAALPCFVAGEENRLASAVVERLLGENGISSAAQLFNPLVLTGPSGSGKSHLVRGLARKIRQSYGNETVAYFTAMDFTRELHAAREEDELTAFRLRLSRLLLLVVEDLQRLPQRFFVQRELRDTIDKLANANGIALFTSQQSPATISGLDAGLRDRLTYGLAVRLRPPGANARQEILRLAASARRSPLDADQLRSLAKRIDGPAPRLLRAMAELELASATGQDVAASRQPLTLKEIIAVVARYYSLTQAALRSPARRKSLVYARGIVTHLARTLTDLSYAQIGRGLGGRDHTTMMHAQQNIKKELISDVATQQAIEKLQRILTTT